MTEIRWTEAGRKHAAAHNLTTAGVEAMLEADAKISGFTPRTLIGHVIEADPDDDEAIFRVTPNDDRTGYVIDGARWKRQEVLEEGPFKGRAVMMPVPMTEGEA